MEVELSQHRPRTRLAVPSQDHEAGHSSEINDHDLPPADHGRAAWLVCACCSMMQFSVWGFSSAFGVFQTYFEQNDILKGNTTGVTNIGACHTGIIYLSAPITFTVLTKYPSLRPLFGPVGLVLAVVGFLASSFTASVTVLIITQGAIAGLGCGLLYSPSTLYLDEWFVERKGLAYGIVLSSKSLAGGLLPFVLEATLQRYGYVATMRAWTVTTIMITSPLLYYLRPRIPVSTDQHMHSISYDFLSLPSFWALQVGNLLQSMGYFFPRTYIESYASAIGLQNEVGTLMLSLINAASVPGSLILGILNDRFEVFDVILISTVGSTLAVFIFWGLASQAAPLTIFAILYGFFAGGFSATWSGSMKLMGHERPALDTGLLFGLLSGVRGIGNVISGPLSSVLIPPGSYATSARFGYSTQYEWLIVFTGLSALLGGWSWGHKEIKACVKWLLP